MTEHSQSSGAHHGARHDARPDAATNVGRNERILSAAAGSALIAFGVVRRTFPLSAITALAGVPLLVRGVTGHCPVYETLGINSAKAGATSAGVEANHGIHVRHSVTVNAAPEDLYAFWHHFENLPQFMEHLESVSTLDDRRSHWVAKAPLGSTVEWDAEITADVPGERIAWRSLAGADVANEGWVRFKALPEDRGTQVEVSLRYDPPAGVVGATIAKLFGEEPHQQISADLRRFKNIVEAGETPTTDGQPSGRSDSDQHKESSTMTDEEPQDVGESSRVKDPTRKVGPTNHYEDQGLTEFEQKKRYEAKKNRAKSLDDELDVGLDDTFPASDPPATW